MSLLLKIVVESQILASGVLLLILLVAVKVFNKKKRNTAVDFGGFQEPPQPSWKIPVIGHLHLMAGFEVPYQAFTELRKKLGEIFQLKLGFVKCVVVNGQKNIREALVTKGHHFDSRPNFQRYQQLFCGNKENSLAFCNWSNTQKTRRDMLKTHTFPRAFTHKFNSLESLISQASDSLIDKITCGEFQAIKPLILRISANIFTNHFCSKSFSIESDAEFNRMVEDFDEIFYEVNQGYAADFLPFLLPFHKKNLKRVNNLTHEIREFVLKNVIEDRFDRLKIHEDPEDYVESLIQHVKSGNGLNLSWDSALFALEDIIGGHAAVGNFLMKLLAFLAQESEVQEKIYEEILKNVGNDKQVSISDRTILPYTEAAIFEAIRLIASPIVPRVANRDSVLNGYKIEKGTLIFLNNYDLSMSKDLWEEPDKFKPERFIRDGRLVKPEHFLPFGGGRRSCMGYKMVQFVSFGILGSLVQRFRIYPETQCGVPVGSLALPKDTFRFKFERR